MRYFYDFEFVEDGERVDPIWVGIVAEDGREYEAIFKHSPWRRILDHAWLRANVVPQLPGVVIGGQWVIDLADPRVKAKWVICEEIEQFLTSTGDAIELWGYYSAYDHVCLAQLWGSMSDLPPGIPMYTHDLMQEMDRLGVTPDSPAYPAQKNEHNALADARWNRDLGLWLSEVDKWPWSGQSS